MIAEKPYLIMHRISDFIPDEISRNQCAKVGNAIYHYRLIIAFNNTVKLDDRNFIFDSEDLTKEICDIRPSGSCEEMHSQLSELIFNFFKSRNIDVLIWKLAIVTEDQKINRSWFEHINFTDDTSGLTRKERILALSPHLI